MQIVSRRALGASAIVALTGAAASAGVFTGPSSSATPYLTPMRSGVSVTSILTVGDSVPGVTGGGYRMAGIPDGLGAFDNGDGTFTVLMNHEFGATTGVTRAHGSAGAFISRWVIDTNTLQVLSGQDQIQTVNSYDAASSGFVSGTRAFNRLCSADLAAASAYFFSDNGVEYGTAARIFASGEETTGGRAFAHIATGAANGESWEISAFGAGAWENVVANPFAQRQTIVAGLDDVTNGQMYFYIGEKQTSGNDVERAGLIGGTTYGVAIQGVTQEDRFGGLNGATRFNLANLGDLSGVSAGESESVADAAGVTRFLRPEDGAWDPNSPNDFYFVTTDRYNSVGDGTGTQDGRSRLFRLSFDDITDPTSGGNVEILLDGTEGQQMMDNVGFDRNGNLLIQEDPGGNDRSARTWVYDTNTGEFFEVLQHDAARFGDNGVLPTAPYNNNEESSGVIDMSEILGEGWFLATVQAHYGLADPELVQDGQLVAFFIPAPGALSVMGLAGFAAIRRRR
jgi:hypothetical protein